MKILQISIISICMLMFLACNNDEPTNELTQDVNYTSITNEQKSISLPLVATLDYPSISAEYQTIALPLVSSFEENTYPEVREAYTKISLPLVSSL